MNSPAQDDIPPDLLLALQQGLPLEPRPFRTIARQVALTEEDVLEATRRLFDEGKARRFGAVFDSQALGYRGTLCAVSAPETDLERCAGLVSSHPGVTHCYEREGMPNLWFTLTALDERLNEALRGMADKLAPYDLLNLPATRTFKIQVVFDVSRGAGPHAAPPPKRPVVARPGPVAIGAQEKALVRLLQGNIPVCADPFGWAAAELERGIDETLDLLKSLKTSGAMRRVCVILRHRAIGFVANGMCTWKVDPECVEEAGARLAACSEVTHCYERTCRPSFPFNLFAMIHATSRDEAVAIMKKISKEAGLAEGRILFSVREFAKSSMTYFSEASKGERAI